jgi:WD40 repeat protein
VPGLAIETPDARPLIATHGCEHALGAQVIAVRFAAGQIAAALGDGTVRFVAPGERRLTTIACHQGAILCMCAAHGASALLTGGDDGRGCRVTSSGSEIVVERDQWIDAVASHPCGVDAFAAGKAMVICRPKGRHCEISLPAPVSAMAVYARGLAAAHSGGVTLIDLLRNRKPNRTLARAGVYAAVTASPDGRFVMTATYGGLHGWRLRDEAHMQMGGYPTKPRSLSWSSDGVWLASSGAAGVVLWPFTGADGPVKKSALALGPRGSLVTAVACHPQNDAIAAGYQDGFVALVRRRDQVVLPVRNANGDAVTDIAFDAHGRLFGYGTEQGALGVLDVGGTR